MGNRDSFSLLPDVSLTVPQERVCVQSGNLEYTPSVSWEFGRRCRHVQPVTREQVLVVVLVSVGSPSRASIAPSNSTLNAVTYSLSSYNYNSYYCCSLL